MKTIPFKVIIPARYASQRFPAKVLAKLNGKPMVQHAYERAVESGASDVVIAVDDERVLKACEAFSAPVYMTQQSHRSGTERAAEIIRELQWRDNEIVVILQADEPFIPIENIQQSALLLAETAMAKVATLREIIKEADDLLNPNVVKVVMDHKGFANYFSRTPIPWNRIWSQENFTDKSLISTINLDTSQQKYYRHIGLYAYRAGFIQQYIAWAPAPQEISESLEQLRVLWHGEKIVLAEAVKASPIGIDTPEDLAALEKE